MKTFVPRLWSPLQAVFPQTAKAWSAVPLSPDLVADIGHPSRSALGISARPHELGPATVQAWREIVVAGYIRLIPIVP